MKIKKMVISLILILVSFSLAQELSIDEVLDKMKLKAETIEDIHFLLTGKIIDADGTEIILEVDVSAMPMEQTTRAEFYQPDALADNITILDKDVVYNYVYLTNQATLFSANDPDALGGLLPAGEADSNAKFEFDLEKLFAGWTASIDGYEKTDNGNIYNLRFDNKEEDVVIDHVNVTVYEDIWIPTDMIFYKKDNSLFTELHFEDISVDAGLNIDDLLYLP
ncbi:MAG TPA: outer membrane lipoprotein carrier protein LolA, partial [Trueperaceae bacterium]|nr:outer membrane lipoprotein carrier protein LolA [Trueperaceae bacterium]